MFVYECNHCNFRREYATKNSLAVGKCRHKNTKRHKSLTEKQQLKDQLALIGDEEKRKELQRQADTAHNWRIIKMIEFKNNKKIEIFEKKLNDIQNLIFKLQNDFNQKISQLEKQINNLS